MIADSTRNKLKPYIICAKHNIPFKIIEIKLHNRDDAIEGIIRNQFGRRNIAPFVRAELSLRLEGIVKGRGKEKQKRTRRHFPWQNT